MNIYIYIHNLLLVLIYSVCNFSFYFEYLNWTHIDGSNFVWKGYILFVNIK